MKRKQKFALALALMSALSLSAGVFVACGEQGPGGDNTPPDYGFENPPTTGGDDAAKPDEGFVIDGKFDEAAYASQKWFHGVKVEKSDDNLVYSGAVDEIENAAKFSMTSFFGENGIYIATSYKAAVGEQLYVNPDRTSFMNSITELYFAAPGFTSINDEGVCEIDMEPTGKLTFKRKNSSGSFIDFATTNDMMAQLGVTCNGEVGEFISEGSQRATEYSCELFIPWSYVDKIAGEGAADAIKEDGEIRLNAAPITSYNYNGTNKDLDRWWWMMGSQLDNGSWGNVNGWYHFDKDGLVAYDLDIKEATGGKVMERFGYDFAVANNSVTLLIQADEGKAISDIKVNGESYYDRIVYPDSSSISSGYITITSNKVTQKLTIEAEFMDVSRDPVAFTAEVYGMRFGTKYELEGATKVTLTGSETATLDIVDGKITGELVPGRYTAKLVGEDFADYPEILVEFLGEDFDLAFGLSAFTQGKFGTASDSSKYEIDDSHANDVNGYIVNQLGNSFFPITNEKFGDSVFTVNFNKGQQTADHSFLIRHIFENENADGKKLAIQAAIKILDGNLIVQWYLGTDWGVNSIPKDDGNLYVWEPYMTLPKEFLDEFVSGDGVDLTMVREDNTFHVFASIHGGETVVYFRSYTVADSYSEEGYWAISVMNSAAGARVHFCLDDSENAADAWTSFSAHVTKRGNGDVSATHETAKIGEKIVITVTPDSGYYATVMVNGELRRLTDGKLELTAADGLNIEVEVIFEEISEISLELDVETSLLRLGKTVSLEGASVILTGDYVTKTLEISGGKISGDIMPGTYVALLNVYTGAIVPVELVIDEHGSANIEKLVFEYDAFTQGKFGTASDSSKYEIDDSHANDVNGYIVNQLGNSFFPTMNEAVGNSVFSATFTKDMQSKDSTYMLRYIFENKTNTAIQACVKIINGVLSVQWYLGGDWGVSSIPKDDANMYVWEPVMQLPQAFLEAFVSGDGVTLTMVHENRTFHVFASINDGETVVYFRSYTVAESYSDTGYWAISVFDSNKGIEVPFKLEENADELARWTTYNVALTAGDNGTATLDKTSAKIGEKVTLTVNADSGYYAIVKVNGVEFALEGSTLEIALAEGDGLSVAVEVTFAEIAPVHIEIEVEDTLQRLGKSVSLDGVDVVFTGILTYTFTIENGKLAGQVQPGTYQVTLDAYAGAINTLEIVIDEDGNANVEKLAFEYDAFTQGLGVNVQSTVIDDSHANEENGYVTGVSGNAFFPTMNEAVGDSVFSATFKQSMQSKDNSLMIRYIFTDKKTAIQACVKIISGKLSVQWNLGGDWGVSSPAKDDSQEFVWEPVMQLPQAFHDEFVSGDGVTLTMVREGNTYHVFASIKNGKTVVYFRSYTYANSTATGYWAISIFDSNKGIEVPFSFEESEEAIEQWTTYSVDVEKTGEGSVTPDKTTAKIGEKITLTVTPDEGYIVSSVLVNGEPVSLTDGKLELSVTEGSGTTIKVEVTFAEKQEKEVTLTVNNLQRLGKSVSLEGMEIILTSTAGETKYTVTNGTISDTFVFGTYTAKLNAFGGAVADIEFTVDRNGASISSLAFEYDAFTQGLGVNVQGTKIDDSKANDEGTITNTSGNAFFPTLNEALGDSVFSATFKQNQQQAGKNNSFLIRYIFTDKKTAIQACVKVISGALSVQWNLGGDWGVSSPGKDDSQDFVWEPVMTLPTAFHTAYTEGDGVTLTMVRSGNTYYVFASINDGEDVVYFRSYTHASSTATGYWAISIFDSQDGAVVPFKLEESEEAIEQWTTYSVDVKKTGEGSVTPDKTTAKIGEKITLTVTPDEGYIVSSVLVNGEPVSLTDGKLEIALAEGNHPTVTVEVVFAEKQETEVSLTVEDLQRLGKSVSLEGMKIILTSTAGETKYTVTNGAIADTLAYGTYTAKLNAYEGAVAAIEFTVSKEGASISSLAFVYDAFTQSKTGSVTDASKYEIDDSHANEPDGYVTNVKGNSFFPTTNETFGDSAFTATLKASMVSLTSSNKMNGLILAYIFEGTNVALGSVLKNNGVNNEGKVIFQWRNDNGLWGHNKMDGVAVWDETDLNAFYDEFYDDNYGIDLTMVRSNGKFYVFATSPKTGETIFCREIDVPAKYENTKGHWAIAIMDTYNNNNTEQINVPFKLEEDAAAIDAWLDKLPGAGQAFTANVSVGMRLGKTVTPAGGTVTLTGLKTYTFPVDDNGTISGKILPGTYSASFTKAGATGYNVITGIEFIGSDEGFMDLAFEYDVFKQGMGTNVTSTVIDDSHANEANGYVTNVSGNAFFPATNEAFGDSVFTATFKASQTTDKGGNGMWLRYIFNGTTTCLMPTIKIYQGNLIFQWKFETNSGNAWGYPSLTAAQATDKNGKGLSWDHETLSAEALAAFNGDGLNMTMVRSGNTFHVFITMPETGEIVGYNSATLTGEQPAMGHWAMSIGNSAGNNTQVFFSLDDSAEAVNGWLAKIS